MHLYARDEVTNWFHQQRKHSSPDLAFRQAVDAHIKSAVKRAETMACKVERELVKPFFYYIIERILRNIRQ